MDGKAVWRETQKEMKKIHVREKFQRAKIQNPGGNNGKAEQKQQRKEGTIGQYLVESPVMWLGVFILRESGRS
jgi:hypothetical protein